MALGEADTLARRDEVVALLRLGAGSCSAPQRRSATPSVLAASSAAALRGEPA